MVFLTGVVHTSWATEVTTRATATSPAAVELVVPSVTSDNVDDFLGVPPGTAGPVAGGLIRATNPHVKWVELDGHGYGVLEVRPDSCRMDWYHLRDRTRRNSPAVWVAGWSVAAGAARLRRETRPPVPAPS